MQKIKEMHPFYCFSATAAFTFTDTKRLVDIKKAGGAGRGWSQCTCCMDLLMKQQMETVHTAKGLREMVTPTCTSALSASMICQTPQLP